MTAAPHTRTQRRPLLIVVTGATASGKSDLAAHLAARLGCDVISADSRQIYRGMAIGTAAPGPGQLALATHHLVGTLDPGEYYSAARFEEDALALLRRQWEHGPCAVVCGGSMMYVDALTDGIDPLPTIAPDIRARVRRILDEHGPDGLLAYLETIDPAYAAQVDPANTRRVAHAVEITIQAGCPYSELRTGRRAERPFDILKVALRWDRDQLFARINARVDAMMADGLENEARSLLPLRHLNALNTVGYKEMFAYFDGRMALPEATARIAKNTRVYAKKQLTWLARPAVRPTLWLDPDTALSRLLALAAPYLP